MSAPGPSHEPPGEREPQVDRGDAADAGARWTDQGERSNLVAMRLMAWIALTLGRRVARWVLHPITLYFLAFAPAARSESASAAKPWFCEVISTLPVASFRTGWLQPRWPNFSLYVRPPRAHVRS